MLPTFSKTGYQLLMNCKLKLSRFRTDLGINQKSKCESNKRLSLTFKLGIVVQNRFHFDVFT